MELKSQSSLERNLSSEEKLDSRSSAGPGLVVVGSKLMYLCYFTSGNFHITDR